MVDRMNDSSSFSSSTSSSTPLFTSSRDNAGAVILLMWLTMSTLFVASLVTWQYWDRSREMVQNAMAETGNVLLMAMEGSMRSGRHPLGGAPQMQYLLEELMLRDAVQFFAVTTANGIILFHSDPSRIGKRLSDTSGQWIQPPDLEDSEQKHPPFWAHMDMEGQTSFVVYRRLCEAAALRHRRSGAVYLFLGMDPAPLVRAHDGDRRRALAYGGSSLAFGFTVVACVYAFQRLSTSRRRQREAEALMDELALTLPDGLILFDLRGRAVGMNDAALHLLHLNDVPREGLVGGRLTELFPPELQERVARLRRDALLPDSELCLEYEGRTTYLSMRGGKIGSSHGEKMGYLVLLRDISEVRRLEAEVRRREKLAAIGNLAAGVAHELRNPLSSIKGYATYFSERFPDGSDEREAAQVMVRETDRLNRTITELIGLARPTAIHARIVSLVDVVKDMLKLIRQDAERRGVVIALHAGEVPLLSLDPDRIRQVALNVCINALDAMPSGGTLTLSIHEEPAIPNMVILDIQDTGTGIAPEDIAHVFDPYFTTKGHGTGLGLATVHKIMEAHGGSVSVTSVQGEGACFRLCFPLFPCEPFCKSEERNAS